jgi:lipoyl-dependent peroxiredoxin
LSFRVVRSAEASWRGAVPDQVGASFNITRIELRTVGDVPGVDHAFFRDIATKAKDCTVSRALTGTEITPEATVASG